MAEAQERFGRIDILINNVGGTIWAKPYAHYEEDADRGGDPPLAVPDALVLPRGAAVHAGAEAAASIVNVSSVATRGINRVPYAAAKGGVNASPPASPSNMQDRASASAAWRRAAPRRRRGRSRATAAPNRARRRRLW